MFDIKRKAFMLAKGFSTLWNSTFILGACIIVAIWAFVTIKIQSDDELAKERAISELTALSQVIQNDVEKTTQDLDRILKFLRRAYERSNYDIDWPSLISEDFTWNTRTVQIAVIDKAGKMITSTAMLHPKKPVDLSDREHFRWHRDGRSDDLYISRPLIGRASGKWSIQFARKLFDAKGDFAGVLVVSLAPEALLSTYGRLNEYKGYGFAMVGSDDVIRATAGVFADKIGRSLPEGRKIENLQSKGDGDIYRGTIFGVDQLSSTRPISGTSMKVLVTMPDPLARRVDGRLDIYLPALALTLAIALAVLTSLKRQRRHVRQIVSLANTDILTELPNRLTFQRTLWRLTNGGKQFTLMLIDLDRFKAVNDTFGHPTGDTLLKLVGERLRNGLRAEDQVFRLGGDEFAVLFDAPLRIEQASRIADRICRRLSEPFVITSHQVSIGASVGIAHTGSGDGAAWQHPDHFLKAADAALYLAKTSGRNTHRTFDDTLHATAERRRMLSRDLALAIDSDGLEMFYQSKVDLQADERVIGYEALLRWRHPTLGMVPPSEFVALAEEDGLIVKLGVWILKRVCRDIARYGVKEPIAVNCSAAQLKCGTLVQELKDELALQGIRPSQIEIEITETMLMGNDAATIAQLAALRDLGVRIALDDFGTGYSSLAYLERYPIDYLKIDRSFVSKLDGANARSSIVRAIISLARELQMEPVAEGVETEGQKHALAQMGCRMAQGYLFAKPAPPSALWRTAEDCSEALNSSISAAASNNLEQAA